MFVGFFKFQVIRNYFVFIEYLSIYFPCIFVATTSDQFLLSVVSMIIGSKKEKTGQHTQIFTLYTGRGRATNRALFT